MHTGTASCCFITGASSILCQLTFLLETKWETTSSTVEPFSSFQPPLDGFSASTLTETYIDWFRSCVCVCVWYTKVTDVCYPSNQARQEPLSCNVLPDAIPSKGCDGNDTLRSVSDTDSGTHPPPCSTDVFPPGQTRHVQMSMTWSVRFCAKREMIVFLLVRSIILGPTRSAC